ncbi:hypothetical protein TNCV_2487031 [Trichonephila clavipes]|uniref:Secreted protein n=1 Tax=Trichonephila clavipes TaxID=2585209 RepID=A0A8X6VZQ8_TRICX|nr:hypothetical protein TNCV_2487031 [Trichonephila clavipes]
MWYAVICLLYLLCQYWDDSDGCGCCWSCRPMIYDKCSIGDGSSDLVGQGNCTIDQCRSSVSRSQTVRLQVFSWHPSDQHMVITGTKRETAFIREHNRSPFHPSMSPGNPLQTTMA